MLQMQVVLRCTPDFVRRCSQISYREERRASVKSGSFLI